MINPPFKSGTLVKLPWGDQRLTVIGQDSVGSVICEWPHEGCSVQAYFAPEALTLAGDDPFPDLASR
jgi:uncharacterized protein YodC (DUF2158 family)